MFRLGSSSRSSKIPMRRTIEVPPKRMLRVGRNDPCPCNSGKKYKHCHEPEGEAFLTRLYREQEAKRREAAEKKAGVSWFRRFLNRTLR